MLHSESSSLPPPFIITAEDASCENVSWVESNCACSSDGTFSHNGLPSKLSFVPPSSPNSLYVSPHLYTDNFAKDLHLVFNPLGQAGVIVLNETAFSLLKSFFGHSQTLLEGLLVIGEPTNGMEIATRLVELGLLQPIEWRNTGFQNLGSQVLTSWLHITNECNLRCSYCYLHKTPDRLEVERGRQAIDSIFRSAVANGFRYVKLKYAGGEVTLNFHTVHVLHDYAQELASKHGLELEGIVISNGVAITNQMIEDMRARNIHLVISLDGIGEYHDKQRYFINGHGSFGHVNRTLDRLAAGNFKPAISITISNRNLKGLPEVVDYVLKHDLPFTLNFYRENDCSSSFADLSYVEDQIIHAMEASFAVIENNLPRYSLLGILLDRARLNSPHDRPCGVGDNYLVIDHKGGIAKCQMEIEQTITDVSVPDPLKVIREDRRGVQHISVNEKEGCRECSWRYWCAGGCPALTFRATGRFDVKSPNCRIYQTLFPQVLRLEAKRLFKYSQPGKLKASHVKPIAL